jgi:hypothetical protein
VLRVVAVLGADLFQLPPREPLVPLRPRPPCDESALARACSNIREVPDLVRGARGEVFEERLLEFVMEEALEEVDESADKPVDLLEIEVGLVVLDGVPLRLHVAERLLVVDGNLHANRALEAGEHLAEIGPSSHPASPPPRLS